MFIPDAIISTLWTILPNPGQPKLGRMIVLHVAISSNPLAQRDMLNHYKLVLEVYRIHLGTDTLSTIYLTVE